MFNFRDQVNVVMVAISLMITLLISTYAALAIFTWQLVDAIATMD